MSRQRIPDKVFFYVLDRDGWRCVYCRKRLYYGDEDWEDDNVEIDHKTPVSRGGSNLPDNLQATCGYCNARKSAKTHEEYLAYIRIYGVFDEDDDDDSLF